MRGHEESRPTRSRTAFREYVRTLSLVLCRTTSVAWLTGAGCSGQGRQHFQYPLVDPMRQSGWLRFFDRAWSKEITLALRAGVLGSSGEIHALMRLRGTPAVVAASSQVLVGHVR